ncbi:MAG: tetratricopeptide repeat protein [Bryobacteraceae bacterium]|jgi:tetratricopeptide (TPR) repeat protein
MRYVLLLLVLIQGARGDPARYELRGRLLPGTRASVWLHGATAPFEASTLADDDGHFRFRDVESGAYVLGVFVLGRGEIRRTIEVGPSQARGGNRIELAVELRDAAFDARDSFERGAMVSAKELSIPDEARRAYDEAGKKLARHEVDAAVAHLRRAVEIAPQFAEAWNHLGTIAYQTRDYAQAESCFRKALAADPKLFQPLVNLGGVLINLKKFDEALQYNLYAKLNHPNDALANSQLGMNYFFLDQPEMASKYLTAAKQIDPAHFSHPQLVLAQIDLNRQDRAAAVVELEEFLQYHPDAPEAGKIKDDIARLGAPSDPAKEFAATGMARSFVESPEPAADAAIGSGRHFRILLKRTAPGVLTALPREGGRLAAAPGFEFSAACLKCHAAGEADHPQAMNCASCHAAAGAGKPSEAACLKCHVATGGPGSGHGATSSGEENIELNSAGYRLLGSHCYRAAAGKLTCATCHPPHTFSKTMAEFRAVCRSCHPTQHNGAALECPRCHMPKRQVADVPGILVTDHRIQRPL